MDSGDVIRNADGSVERWNPVVGKWDVTVPARIEPVQTKAVDGRQLVQVPRKSGKRSYASARMTRTTGGFGSSGNSSADFELSSGLTLLRSRSRQMVRDSAYAKRAKVVVVNNVIGAGIGMQCQTKTSRDELNARVNADIEQAYCDWSEAQNCHTGGAMHFNDLERAAMGQVFEAGEVFIRKHYSKFGNSKVPLALEMIEAERLGDGIADPGVMMGPGVQVRMGIEQDIFGRAVAYWIRHLHPGDIRQNAAITDRWERVPAADIFHLRIVDRWPQTRGEPWMHTGLRKIDDMNEATSGELAAVRASSMYFATITTPESANPLTDDVEDDTGQGVMDMEPLTIQELKPGEGLDFHAPNRPNAGLDAFLRHMLREMAAGCGPSYESISRDYSQSNYSSSRLSLLEDRDLWKTFQLWWIRNFRLPLHKVWLNQAVLAGAIPSVTVESYALAPSKFEAVVFKPRGWSWIDPTKEVNAYKEAIKGGLTTLTDVIAQTADGRDIEDVIETRKRELAMLEDAGIFTDTTVMDPALGLAAKQPAAPAEEPPEADENTPPKRVLSLAKGTLQ